MAKQGEVPILERGDRGFHGYGEPFNDSYGSVLEVYESSAASGPHVWLKIDASAWDHDRAHSKMHEATAHLDPEQAYALIRRLEAWLAEIPTRWAHAEQGKGERG